MNLMTDSYFWSVVIEENSIQAAIWTIKDGLASIVSVSNPSRYDNDETLVTSSDTSLSFCIQNLPADADEPSKTVFGVPPSWVTDGQIERKHLDKIRLVCNKLSLAPTGFVVLPEAIAHFEKSQTKTPMSAVLIGIYAQSIDVSVFKLGNLAGSVNVARSTSITDDVIEGLARFGNGEALPSRFLLYDSNSHDLEAEKQELIKADWMSAANVKFLHTPQVEIFDNQAKMAAVSLAGAAEMGQTAGIAFHREESKKEDIKDVLEDPENVDNIEGLVDPTTLGFSSSFDSTEANQTLERATSTKKKIKLPEFDFKGLKEKFLKENLLFIGVIVIFFILVGGFVAFWFLPKATVTIIVAPKKIGGVEKIIYDPKANSIDTSKLIIPAKYVTATVSADKTKTTSGTKTVGTPSKGSVTFYNVGGATTIPAGTELTASSLNFTLDSDVQIASASGAASAATSKGNITAEGVGADYNLASGTFFTVGNFSSSLLQAKNDADLSGGTSQEVTAVASDDATSLTSDLTAQLLTAGETNLKSNLPPGSLLIDSTVTSQPSQKNFDHQIGDQAATVKLSMTAKVTGLTVARADMNTMAQNIFKSQAGNGYVLDASQIDFRFEATDTNFIINLLPSINNNQIVGEISGKSETQVKEILSHIPGYSDAQIQIKPSISFLPFLPHIPDHITVRIEAQ